MRGVVPAGPLAGARWPAGSVHAGMLLHDDGRALWSYRLDGKRRLLWRHAAFHGAVVAAAPAGQQLAYVLGGPGDRQSLYLLGADGSVRLADTIRAGWLHDAVFVRGRLYWSRSDEGGRVDVERLRVLGPGGPRTVHVPLRVGEYPARLSAYPGSPLFTLALGRRVQPPPPALLVLLEPSRRTDPARFGELLPLRDLDNRHGVAWLSPTSFVTFARGQLRLFDESCIWRGSKVVYSGRGIDDFLVDEGAWPLLPLERERVLVMPRLPAADRHDEAATLRANERPLHWAVLDLRTRRLTQTPLRFSETGWVGVQPARPYVQPSVARNCTGFAEPPS